MGNPSRQDFNAATSSVGPQQAKALDLLPHSSVTLAVAITDGTAEYSVEITLDDINDPAVTPFWFPHSAFPAGTTVSKYGELTSPWAWARLNIASITGSMSFYVSQSMEF